MQRHKSQCSRENATLSRGTLLTYVFEVLVTCGKHACYTKNTGVVEEVDYSQFLVVLNFPLFFITRICLYFYARMR